MRVNANLFSLYLIKLSESSVITCRECEILDVAKAGQLVDQTEQSPKSAFLTARKGQIYSRAECIK